MRTLLGLCRVACQVKIDTSIQLKIKPSFSVKLPLCIQGKPRQALQVLVQLPEDVALKSPSCEYSTCSRRRKSHPLVQRGENK